ncbi:TIGR03085 family metal-binding protein [Arachnia propionica]|nr:TIGR03085 family metal-binding protein [Arachnia propionica]
MSLAARQRAALCDLMADLGATAPTRCAGWQVQDLAAHLWIREHRPAALPGIGLARFADRTERIQQETLHLKGFETLVTELRRPGWVMRPLDRLVNAVEFFIHHEDVLRANDRSQRLTDAEQGQLWRVARLLARKVQRSWGGQLILQPTDRPAVRYGQGPRPVRLNGQPSELLLFLSGRDADVTVAAEPDVARDLKVSIGAL